MNKNVDNVAKVKKIILTLFHKLFIRCIKIFYYTYIITDLFVKCSRQRIKVTSKHNFFCTSHVIFQQIFISNFSFGLEIQAADSFPLQLLTDNDKDKN